MHNGSGGDEDARMWAFCRRSAQQSPRVSTTGWATTARPAWHGCRGDWPSYEW